MKFFHWLDDHKTKLMGIVVSALGALLANRDLLEQLLPPNIVAWVVLISGVGITVIGSTNTARQKAKQNAVK